ncbi:tetratricopeptide repeat protein [Flavobacterium sp.]|uniref:tetratricopeptide repeat-containing sensor histidine kinase n=1 Tax=Flavobacterium sp. TaxID=239 RepID=UPI00260CBA01|nr:tetratricopeptide repeat protein [Flavobacterium sp.]
MIVGQNKKSDNNVAYKKFVSEKNIEKLPVLVINLFSNTNDSILQASYNHLEKIKAKRSNSVCELFYINATQARILNIRGKFDEAIKRLNEVIKTAPKDCNAINLLDLYNDLGSSYNYTGKNELALNNYYKALKEAQKKKDTSSQGAIHLNIGNIFFVLKKYDKAKAYYNKCIAISSYNKKHDLRKASGFDAMGNLYLNTSETMDLAKENFTKAILIFRKNNYKEFEYSTLNNLGIAYETEGNYQKALEIYKQVYDYAASIQNAALMGNVCFDMGFNYINMNNSKDAIKLFEQSYFNYGQIGMLDGMIDVNRELSNLYKKEKEFEKAFNHLSKFTKYKDSLNKASNSERLVELKKDYEFGIEREQLNSKVITYKLRNTILLISMLCLLLVAGLIFLYKKRKAASQEAKKQEQFTFQLLQNTEEERGRIAGELHDSVNHDLLAIKNNLINGKQIAVEEVANVIEEVRNISRNLHPAVLENIGLEASIENLCERLTEIGLFTTCEITYNQKLNKNKELQLYRIIQEALNNTLKHGKADAAKVILTSTEDSLLLEVKDNGTGFNVEQELKNPKSFGLQSILQRAKAITAKININSSNKGTVILINIPV